jgi:hypothetical protein
VREEPRQVLAQERRARAEVAIGGVVGARDQPRVDQQLEARLAHALGMGALRDHRREPAARGVAAHADPLGIAAEHARVFERVAVRRPRVVLRRREAVLGALAIVDREHRTARRPGELAAERIAPVELADHVATLMEVQDQRARAVEIGRHVEPGDERALRAGHAVLLEPLERAQRRRDRGRATGRRARLGRRLRMQRGRARGTHRERDVRVERAPADHRRRTRQRRDPAPGHCAQRARAEPLREGSH